MKQCVVLALAALTAPAFAAEPNINTGNAFIKSCVTDEPDALLVGFVVGFAAGGRAAISPGQQAPWCAPPGVNYGQQGRVLCKYLKDNPAETHDLMSIITVRAYVAAWPCPSLK